MIRHEDGMVTAENAAEVMQCLLAGYVSEEESDTWPIKLTEDKSLAEKIAINSQLFQALFEDW